MELRFESGIRQVPVCRASQAEAQQPGGAGGEVLSRAKSMPWAALRSPPVLGSLLLLSGLPLHLPGTRLHPWTGPSHGILCPGKVPVLPTSGTSRLSPGPAPPVLLSVSPPGINRSQATGGGPALPAAL